MTQFINKTPHPVKVFKDGEVILELPACENPWRLKEESKVMFEINNIEVKETKLTKANIEDHNFEDVFIASMPVAQILKTANIVSPADLVRDEKGNVIGCKSFTYFT
jgi:hypothetical protein